MWEVLGGQGKPEDCIFFRHPELWHSMGVTVENLTWQTRKMNQKMHFRHCAEVAASIKGCKGLIPVCLVLDWIQLTSKSKNTWGNFKVISPKSPWNYRSLDLVLAVSNWREGKNSLPVLSHVAYPNGPSEKQGLSSVFLLFSTSFQLKSMQVMDDS